MALWDFDESSRALTHTLTCGQRTLFNYHKHGQSADFPLQLNHFHPEQEPVSRKTWMGEKKKKCHVYIWS